MTTLPTMFMTRNAPSIPSGILRSIFFCAASGAAINSDAARTAVRLLRTTRDLRRTAQQIDLLLVVRREHFDQQLVRWVARQSAARFQYRFIDRAQTRFELGDGLGCQRRFLL